MNLSHVWVTLLGSRGHDALHWKQVGNDDASDRDILAWARSQQRIVLTADLDFAALATTGVSLPISVVQLRSGSTNPHSVGDFGAHEIEQAAEPLLAGAVLTIEPGRSRTRRL